MALKDNYQLLVEKLDQFIRKYYINQIIRGALYSTAIILVAFLAASLLEHYFYFGTGTRKVLFFSFVGVSLLALGTWVFKPLLNYFQLGKVISHEQAAEIIGNHFTDVKDKLLNVLQLKAQADGQAEKELILASVNQKTEDIKPVPFQSAINLGQNRQYLKYALPPLMLLVVLLFAAPSMIKDSTNRLINNNKEFIPPAPFQFVLDETTPQVVQFEDYPMTVTIEGEELPNEVFINVDNYEYRLTKEAPNKFSYRFSNVQKNTEFKLYAGPVNSEAYTLEVLKKPNVASFTASLDYPAYLGRKDEVLDNIGDLTIPVGTNIQWLFNAQHTDALEILFSDTPKIVEANRNDESRFSFEKRIMKDLSYRLYVSNKSLPKADSIGYVLTVIPDLHPEISVESFQDSSLNKLTYFLGEASDDHGLTRLSFNYTIQKENEEASDKVTVPLEKPAGKAIRYDYTFDVTELGLEPGDAVTYYFEVLDNDGVNGAKAARTGLMSFAMPTEEEIEAQIDLNEEQIKDELLSALEESREVQEQMKELREELLQERELDWQQRKEMERLMERQKELQQQIENAQQLFEENIQKEEELSPAEQRIQEKQERLQEMFDEALSEEMQELMKEIEELLQEMEKEEAMEKMEEMEYSDEELEMELDRMLEMYKQLELEKEMQETIDELQELAEQQEELAEQTENEELPQEELEEKQEEINEAFEEIQEKMDEMEKKNEELENPMEMGDHEEQMESIEEDLEDSQEQLEKQENSDASESQSKAAQKMKSMAGMMQQQMQSGEMEQMEEDMASLRQLLENLVGLSFDQEGLIDEFSKTGLNTPRYVDLVQDQFKLEDDFELIQDSLHALSKRVYQIESFITEKVTEIRSNMRESIDELEERRKPQAAEHQQRTMTNVNDLALMLSEVMNQMQQQMSGMMSGDQMCNNPGGQGQGKSGNVPKDKMSQGQQSINQGLQQMKEALQRGQQPGSKDFAQMAARQAALRNALKQKQQELREQGQGDPLLQEMIDGMDKTEEDLVNKRLTNEMMTRQEEILGRLLEHENAERQREQDERRKSETAQQRERELPPSLQEYLKQREAEIDRYKTVSPSLRPYYKYLVDEYFQEIREN